MKKILIIAGPNGAGKTTFAGEFLIHEACCPEFVNADLIAAGLSPYQPESVAFTAGRLMINRIDELVAAGKNFAFETTLSSLSYAKLIPSWRTLGYHVKLYFLTLPHAEFAISRVNQRVRLGGHLIPEETIRRRYLRGWKHLQSVYLGLVDEWAIYDGSQNPPCLLSSGRQAPPDRIMEDPAAYRLRMIQSGPAKPLDDPDLIGAEAALKRGAAKAVARALAAGLEPIVRIPDDGEEFEPRMDADGRG